MGDQGGAPQSSAVRCAAALLHCCGAISCSRYSPEFAREYLESVRPDLAVGEFWTDCNYSGEDGEEHELDYDQGEDGVPGLGLWM